MHTKLHTYINIYIYLHILRLCAKSTKSIGKNVATNVKSVVEHLIICKIKDAYIFSTPKAVRKISGICFINFKRTRNHEEY